MNDFYGPNTAEVKAFLALLPTLTDEQWEVVCDARNAARGAALDAAWVAAQYTAVYAVVPEVAEIAISRAYTVTWDTRTQVDIDTLYDAATAAADAAMALVVRDRIHRKDFDILTAPMRAAGVDFDALGVDDPPATPREHRVSLLSGMTVAELRDVGGVEG